MLASHLSTLASKDTEEYSTMATLDVSKQPTDALLHMVKALSSMALLNTDEENQRLEEAKKELQRRNRKITRR